MKLFFFACHTLIKVPILELACRFNRTLKADSQAPK
jgi:hypothetical protein